MVDSCLWVVHINNTTLNDYFNKIEDLQEIAASITTQITDAELLAQAYVSINNTSIYDNGMEKWDDCMILYKTWANFKQDFWQQTISNKNVTMQENIYTNSPNHQVY